MPDSVTIPEPKSPHPGFTAILAFSVCLATFVAYYKVKFDFNEPPSTSGDETDYDSIAWELAHGNGFAINTGDPEFRRPYDEAAKRAERFQLPPAFEHVSLQRPPAYPFAVSQLNRLFGRQFWATRVMDAAFMAATLAMVVFLIAPNLRWSGIAVAVVLFIAVDTRTRLYGRAILTEAMSACITSFLIVTLIWLGHATNSSPKLLLKSTLVGCLLGMTILVRSLAILWVPGLCLVVYWIVRRQLGRSHVQALLATLLMICGSTFLVAPWAIRNCRITHEFTPLGTQGQIQLAAAYSDEIWESKGLWINVQSQGKFDSVTNSDLTYVEQDLIYADFAKQQAKDWIVANPGKTLALFPIKIVQECRPRTVPELIILALMCVGMMTLRRTLPGKLLLAVVLTNLFAIGVTWSVEGRFLVPMLLPIHVFATAGACSLIQVMTGQRVARVWDENKFP
ncbi:MAG: hypothetical protein R3C18_23070 [Planctomycetaceae bacterium]